MHNAEEEPRLFDATLAYGDDNKQSTTDILSAWGPFFHKILIDIVEEEHVRLLQCARCGGNVEKVLEDMIQCIGEDAAVVSNTRG